VGKERAVKNYPGVISLFARRRIVLEKIILQGVSFLVMWPYAIKTVIKKAQQTDIKEKNRKDGGIGTITHAS
jgi:hypothetical protein